MKVRSLCWLLFAFCPAFEFTDSTTDTGYRFLIGSARNQRMLWCPRKRMIPGVK